MAKAGQDWQDWTLKTIFHFAKSFLTRNKVSPPDEYPRQGLVKTPQALIFFWSPPFQNLELKVVPSAERGGETDTVVDKRLWTNQSIWVFFIYSLLVLWQILSHCWRVSLTHLMFITVFSHFDLKVIRSEIGSQNLIEHLVRFEPWLRPHYELD